jgi:protease II
MNQMQINWQKVFETTLYTEAAIVKGALENNEIPVQMLNRQDSMYNVVLGSYEIYVPAHFETLACTLLANALKN